MLGGDMAIIDDELCSIRTPGSNLRTADVRIGLGYTAVLLQNGRCGLAYTMQEKERESCCTVVEAGRLAERKASDLVKWLKSSNATARTVALATLNALIELPDAAVDSDILDLLAINTTDSVGMVGYFGPLVQAIKERSRSLHIFERTPIPDDNVLPESRAPELLPECQVVIVTATTLLNRTFDGLLEHCTIAREIVLLGPSTPFLPETFSRRGVTILSGIQVVDAPQILRIISEGGGTRQFRGAVRKLTLRTAA